MILKLNYDLDYAALSVEMQQHRDIDTRLGCQTNGWSSQKRLQSDSSGEIARLLDYASDQLNALSGVDKQLTYWVTQLNSGGEISWHDHAQSDYAGVYYIDDSESGHLVFSSGESIKQSAGLLVLFDGQLMHCVEQYIGDKPRLSLVFNRI